MPTPDEFYTASNRRLQDENDSLKLADAVARSIVDDELRPEQAGFIGSLDYFFLTTVSENGEPTVSYKGVLPHFDAGGEVAYPCLEVIFDALHQAKAL